MADEVTKAASPAEDHKVAQDLEAEAQKKQFIPESVSVNGNNAPIERAEYLKTADANKGKAKEYGLNSYDDLMKKVGLDGTFAQQVVGDLLSGSTGQNVGLHPDAPQENNLTGRVDRTVETATRLKFEGQADAKPVNAVNA